MNAGPLMPEGPPHSSPLNSAGERTRKLNLSDLTPDIAANV